MIAVVMGLCMAVAGGAFAKANAAEEGVTTVTAEQFRLKGTSVRYVDENYDAGVKFHVLLDKTVYDGLSAEAVTGVKLCPVSILGEDSLKDSANTAIVNKTVEKSGWFESKTDTGMMELVVYVYDITVKDYGTDLAVVGYVIDNGVTVYTTEESTSLAKVAKTAAAEETDETKKAQLKGYYVFAVKWYNADGTAIKSEEVEYGEKLTVPDGDYADYAWYNKDGTAKWDIANATVKGNTSLHAKKVNITLPAYTETAVYTGSALSCGLTTNDDYTVTYSQNGNEVAAPINVGSYSVTVSLKDKVVAKWSDGTTDDKSFTFTVTKKTIAVPAADENEYKCTGEEQTYGIAESGDYTLTGNKQTEAGEHTVTVALKDADNTEWADGTTGDKTYTFVISHDYKWTTGETEDVKECACGNVEKRFNKTITETNAQRVSLNVGAENGSAVLDEYSYGLISLAGISDYASVESIKLGEKTITLNTFADEEELAGGKIAVNVKDFGFAYGEQNVVVTVKCEEGDTHEVNVKVLLITAILNNKADLNNFGVIAKACETDSDAWGGYFELGADIEYNGYWSDFVNADSNDALKAMQGFKGVFDGQGHNVKGMRVARISVAGADVGAGIIKVGAFIPKLHKDGVLRNVSFTEAAVGSERSFLVYCGNGLIENIFVKYACFGDSSYSGYSAAHNYGATTTVFAKGEGEGAIVRNVIIDVSECVGIATQADNVNGYIVGQFNKVETLSNVYVINPSDKYDHIVRNIVASSETKVETNFDAGVNYFVYKSFAEMAADETRNYEGFVAPLWTVKEGGLPYVKAQNVTAPAFTTAPSEITKGSSATFVVSANVRLALDEAAAMAGLTLENGVVSVPAGIGDATYTLIATSLFDPTLKTEVTFNVINARKYETITNAQEIDLNVANDGSVNSSASAEIDLTEKFTGNASLSLVKVGDEIISGFEGVEIVGGKATLNVAPFGIKYYGEKEVKLVFTSEGVDYEYTVPVNFITKTIMNGDANVRAIKTLVTALQGGGYYRFGENVTLKWNFYANSDDYRIAVDYPFIGTLDGNGYAISGLHIWSWTAGGFIQQLGETGIIKNIAFKDVQLGGSTAIVYEGSGTIENVFVEVAAFPASGGQPNKNWRNGGLTIFGWQSKANNLKLKNVLTDFTPASAKIKEFVEGGMANKMIFGASTKSVTAVNTVVLGIPDNYDKAQITNYGGVYVRYTDETDNGIAFPVSGWDETYWTVGENAVSWKTK